MRSTSFKDRVFFFVAAAATCLVAWGLVARGQHGDNPYTWHSELVEIDEGASALTLEARILGFAEIDELESFSPGDQVSVTWSGMNGRADAIRAVKVDRGSWTDPFTMPVEFVSVENKNQYLQYLRFRVTVPDEGLAAVSSLEPGEWVTVTTRQQPLSPSETVVRVRPYNSRGGPDA